MTTLELQKMAVEVRKGIVTGVHSAKAGHPGGSLSVCEILTTLYFKEMNVRPDDPQWAERDRLVLSKGHAAPMLVIRADLYPQQTYLPISILKR